MKYCTDNATMIAAAAYPLYLKKIFQNTILMLKALKGYFNEFKQPETDYKLLFRK